MSEDQEKYGKDAPERFADSREEDTWVKFAAAALEHAYPRLNPFAASLDENRLEEMRNVSFHAGNYADAMMVEWRKRARGR